MRVSFDVSSLRMLVLHSNTKYSEFQNKFS
jgi:hypothetical protein